ncbi:MULTISPECIES: tetratricopeptide repeat protein [unclassified Streptomyces]|uniref:tetratricopeptide repeat protein n=1 Tax=unclassified Streptomyces TaxID=2593676 RepID=UPI0012FF3D5D|nr:tetratricopeptide repeat protein [Streptomyces sp. Root1310]
MSRYGHKERGGSMRVIPRPVVPAGPLRDLKDLLYESYLAAGPPTLDEMAAALGDADAEDDMVKAAPSRDTIQRIIKQPVLPARQGDVVSLVAVLTRMAGGEAEPAAQRAASLWLDARLERPLGLSIGGLDPIDLEVHRAIEVEESQRLPGVPDLPTYVARPHDWVLGEVVHKAAQGESQLVMLVGGSSTGKTRACWEAVQLLPEDWRLWHPIDPERPGAALADLPQVGSRTVVWLNESHHYLFTADQAVGEQVAAGLRALLRDQARAPVLVLGTIWPEYRNSLMVEPKPGGPDPHAQARALLTGRELTVPAAFDETAMLDLSKKARRDPRLAYARDRAEQGHITQYLAGAPELLSRFEAAPPGAKAVVLAAMDARRAGHGLDLPHSFLGEACEGYFSDQEWDLLAENWLEEAFAYATRPVRGARGMLTRRRPRRGEPSSEGPLYRLADYLEQQGRQTRRTQRIPPSVWESALRHRVSGRTLAPFARSCGLLRVAFHLESQAAASGLGESARRAGDVLRKAGRLKEALPWYQKAADAGDAESALRAGQLLWQQERWGPALDSFRWAADMGLADLAKQRAWAMVHYAPHLRPQAWMGPQPEAGPSLSGTSTRSALRNPHAEELDNLLAQGQTEAALTLARTLGVDLPPIFRRGAASLIKQGFIDEAIKWYALAFDAGDAGAAWRVGRLLREQGHDDEAIEWYQRGAYAGDRTALQRVAYLMRERGRLDEAVEWARKSADTGDEHAIRLAADLLRLQGKEHEADRLLAYGWELDGTIADSWGPWSAEDER